MPALYETYGNEAQTQLNGGIDDTQTLIEVDAAGPPFPEYGQFRIRIDDELMIVIAGAGTTLWSVVRGAEGTIPDEHDDNALVTSLLTAEAIRYLKSSLWVPVNNGLQASTIGVDDATTGIASNVEVNYCRCAIGRPLRGATKFYIAINTAGVSLTHGWLALYDFDGTTKLAECVGLTTVWQSTGIKTHTFDSGTVVNYSGEGVIVAFNSAGTTKPSFVGTTPIQAMNNIGPNSGTYVRSWRGSAALTTPPTAVQANTASVASTWFIGIE
jgi:hypothetical protein